MNDRLKYLSTIPLWGVDVKVYRDLMDEREVFHPQIAHPFNENGKLHVSINEKILKTAIGRNAKLLIGGKIIEVNEPMLREKRRSKEYENKKSMFADSKPLKLYRFQI